MDNKKTKHKNIHDQFIKRKELYQVHTKLIRKLKLKEVLSVNEAEKERTTVNKHALQYDDLIILNLDKEVYNDFVEMQKLRDQHKIGGLISPRQRALSIALMTELSSKPLFTTLSSQKSLLAFKSLLLQNKAGLDYGELEEEYELLEKIETTTGKEDPQSYKVNTKELEDKVINLLGKPITKKDFEKYFSQKELLLIPLILSKMNVEIIFISKKKLLLELAKEKNDSHTWAYYSVLFQGNSKSNGKKQN